MNLDISSFRTLGVIGAAYFAIRIAGKYLGAYLGCMMAKTTKSVRNYLGLALIPQAGVAIGLAFLGKRMIPGAMGDMLLTIILSSSVLYELIGPACAKAALIYSGSIKKDKLNAIDGKTVGKAGKVNKSMDKIMDKAVENSTEKDLEKDLDKTMDSIADKIADKANPVADITREERDEEEKAAKVISQ